MFICSAQTANPTCAQSFDLHSLQNGIPSTISTLTCFRNVLSCSDTTTLLIPLVKCLIMIGIAAKFSFSASQRAKALIPSSNVLFLITAASTLSEAFRLVLKISEELDPFDDSPRRLSNMKLDYSNLLPTLCA